MRRRHPKLKLTLQVAAVTPPIDPDYNARWCEEGLLAHRYAPGAVAILFPRYILNKTPLRLPSNSLCTNTPTHSRSPSPPPPSPHRDRKYRRRGRRLFSFFFFGGNPFVRVQCTAAGEGQIKAGKENRTKTKKPPGVQHCWLSRLLAA